MVHTCRWAPLSVHSVPTTRLQDWRTLASRPAVSLSSSRGKTKKWRIWAIIKTCTHPDDKWGDQGGTQGSFWEMWWGVPGLRWALLQGGGRGSPVGWRAPERRGTRGWSREKYWRFQSASSFPLSRLRLVSGQYFKTCFILEHFKPIIKWTKKYNEPLDSLYSFISHHPLARLSSHTCTHLPLPLFWSEC